MANSLNADETRAKELINIIIVYNIHLMTFITPPVYFTTTQLSL